MPKFIVKYSKCCKIYTRVIAAPDQASAVRLINGDLTSPAVELSYTEEEVGEQFESMHTEDGKRLF